jgi:hypothetical protein
MKNITLDPAEPIGDLTIVKDFLPSPEQLVPKKTTVQVTTTAINLERIDSQSAIAPYSLVIPKTQSPHRCFFHDTL